MMFRLVLGLRLRLMTRLGLGVRVMFRVRVRLRVWFRVNHRVMVNFKAWTTNRVRGTVHVRFMDCVQIPYILGSVRVWCLV
jgi:hypothetical protein